MSASPQESRKETNPKDAVGTGKTPFSTIPSEVLAELGLVMLEGARKYGRHNYRAAGVRASVYYDAAIRHLVRFWEGEDIDPDSGMPHLVHVMACCVVLRDSQKYGNWTDDRPPKLESGWLEELNAKAKAIVEKYPNPVPAYTQEGTADEKLSKRSELIEIGRLYPIGADEPPEMYFAPGHLGVPPFPIPGGPPDCGMGTCGPREG